MCTEINRRRPARVMVRTEGREAEIRRIRRLIHADLYETEEKLDFVIERLWDDLIATDAYDDE